MKNKKTIIYTIVAIATLIFLVGGATYAYFASSTDADAVINAGVATAKSSAFSSSVSGNIEFNVAFNEMSQSGVSNTYIKTDNATLSVDLSSEDERSTTICNYDVVWVWDSTDRYTHSDITLPYTHDGIKYPYEFSVQVGTDVEKDLSSLDWNEEGTAIISSKTIEVAQAGNKHEDYDVVVRMYNIPINQENLFNKEFKAHIKVENLSCMSVRDTKLSYYVISGETKTKVEIVPKGGYRLNLDKTTCKRGGTVSAYNSITGELTTNIQMGDECEIYFDELPTLTASGSTLSTNYDGTGKTLEISVNGVTDYQIYYSLDKELTRENYSTEGSTTHPEVKEIGTKTVYWCAVAENYAPYCSSNDIVIGEGIISVKVSNYNKPYDGNPHKLSVSDLVPTTATMYYSETTKLTKDNYSTTGKTDEPERTSAGTSIIYWCAVADKYTPQCGTNKIIVNPLTMSVSGQDYKEDFDGNSHSINISVTTPTSGSKIYYSTTTELTKNNYSTAGNENNPTRSELGTTTVYWCASAPNYNPVCGNNKIVITKSLAEYIKNDVYNSIENQSSIANSYPGLYYHDNNLENGAQDYSYRYAGGNYIYPKASEGYDKMENIVRYNTYDQGPELGVETYYTLDYEVSADSPYLEIDSPYRYYSRGEALEHAINDGYIGEVSINNYVCFQEDNCASAPYYTKLDKLYRVIGVDKNNQVKLIKAKTLNNDGSVWNSSGNSIWINSEAETYLNGDYLSSLSSKTNKIADTIWSVGGVSYEDYIYSRRSIKDGMDVELNNSITAERKIGLMYISEYGFASLPKYWLTGYSLISPFDDWMYIDAKEWTITPESQYKLDVYFIDPPLLEGGVGYLTLQEPKHYIGMRPTFNLKADVKIINAGTENIGSIDNPMIIE